MEPSNASEQEKKKQLNEDLVVFMRKRSEQDAPKYSARLRTYADLHRKRRRAAAARRCSEHYYAARKGSASVISARKKADEKDKPESKLLAGLCPPDSAVPGEPPVYMAHSRGKMSEHPGSDDGRMSRRGGLLGRRGQVEEKPIHGRSMSRSRSGEPADACGRRRRRCGRRRSRRRRSCRRRRRSCRRRRRSCRRRRRRSCRRRRRRSCRRRRRRSCRRRRRRSGCRRRRRRRC